jgi:tetratricopeptide (TPR) repeat protein
VYELWSQYYPRDYLPTNNQSATYDQLGQYEKALAEAREAVRRAPGVDAPNFQVVFACLALNRLGEARTSADEARAKKLDSSTLHSNLYRIAFLQNDEAGMTRQVAWSAGKPGVEDIFLDSAADSAAYSGRLGKAREFSRRAVASAEQAEEKETAVGYEADTALWEALFGNSAEARQRAAAALVLSTGRDMQYGAALTLVFAGDMARAQILADDLSKRFPEDTVVRFNYLPTLRAQLALSRNASKAVETLRAAAPHELGSTSLSLGPIYLRGEAFLAAHRGSEAAVEFQKILDHRGVVLNEPIGALAHLQLGRAYALQGDIAKARTAYQDFLGLWKDADRDIPILKQAKAEYAKLQ